MKCELMNDDLKLYPETISEAMALGRFSEKLDLPMEINTISSVPDTPEACVTIPIARICI